MAKAKTPIPPPGPRPDGSHLQGQCPQAVSTERPAELSAPAGLRGSAQARRLGLTFIADTRPIVDGNLDAGDREPERVLRRYLLELAEASEAAETTPPPIPASAPQSAAPPPPPRAVDVEAARLAIKALRNSPKNQEMTS